MNRMMACVVGLVVVVGAPASAAAMDRLVSDVAQLKAAIGAAQPGDAVILRDGVYAVDGNISCGQPATQAAPITVRAEHPGQARIEFNAQEGFKVSGAHWRFEGLHIKGVCATDSECEHAFHLFGDADGVVISGNKVWNYNAQIKSNGDGGTPRKYPDDVVIIGNEFYSEAARATGNPVTPIDVVGGRRWRIVANYIHDFAKGEGNTISYAAFLKGNSKDGLIERNLIVCEALHTGQVRLGLSFGGGGSSPDNICEEGTCTPEHEGGVMRNNIIARCPADVGIYVNKGKDVQLLHNLLYETAGIDVRFDATRALVQGNLTSGRIRARDNAALTEQGNLAQIGAADWGAWFVDAGALKFGLKPGAGPRDAGAALAALPDDFCGAPRDARPDTGAIEGDGCDTTQTHPQASAPTPDMGAEDMGAAADMAAPDDMAPGVDMGSSGADMGAGQADMASPDADMSAGEVDMAGGAGSGAQDEGCMAAGGARGAGAGLWWLAALGFALARRRRV
jgi:hypothetical protein